ncbi:hypothetical protein NW752_006864 [Fusarium irregulare]|uniref:Uncharacterized protein n=1 Tax=Fusarium irregulare TaxID=2494466 RepID=A0A9W8PRX9_9HYPO|nr:hypothetical protein NW766_005743 [Fusarium irregulare]KAJ4015932.1 hypothetical protein NW752_006864 [Fusarium irregulare]
MATRDTVSLREEKTITVGKIDYLLIRHPQTCLDFDDPGDGEPELCVLFEIQPKSTISESALQEFRSSILDRDDVFQPAFLANIIFYGAKPEDVEIEPDVWNELRAWKTKNWYFVHGPPFPKVARGPYVFLHGAAWQPWRVYRDSNACFMKTFKPSPDAAGR